jgi:hypothetical protein
MSRKLIDLTEQVFGRLKVIKYAYTKNGRVYWKCKCSCGNETLVSGSNLKRGNTQSCGCLNKEKISEANKGKHHSEEHKRKNSVAHEGKSFSEETRKKISAARTGKHHSEATRQKLSGENNHNWNPDRQQVKFNKTVTRAMHNLLHNTLKRTGGTKTTHSEKMLGYTNQELVIHIGSLFLPGMSWENRTEWHIDHIKPISLFVKEGITDNKIICALSNLQPLWAEDNLRKNDKYTEEEKL